MKTIIKKLVNKIFLRDLKFRLNNLERKIDFLIESKNQLKKVKNIIKIRNKNAKILDKYLSKINGVSIPERKKNYIETFALYMGRFKKRDKLMSFLIKKRLSIF